MIYFFWLINFVVNKVEVFCNDDDFSSSLSLRWNLDADTGFVVDKFLLKFIFILTSSLWSIDTSVDVDLKLFTEFSSSSMDSRDGISLLVGSNISLPLMISSEVGFFDSYSSVGKGSPGWTLKEPMIIRINNENEYETENVFIIYFVEW